MNFGEALEAVKRGKKISREGWNGKEQYVQLASDLSYTANGKVVNAEHDAIGNKALAFVGTSGVQIGWLASQADMLAEDWEIVRDEYLECNLKTGEAVYYDGKGKEVHLELRTRDWDWIPESDPEFTFIFTQKKRSKWF